MSDDIEKAISIINQKIDDLQRAKKTLIEIFGNLDIQDHNQDNLKLPIFPRKKINRRDALISLLRDSGPLSRSEIVDKSRIPVGTIASILNDKSIFVNKEGKWSLIKKEDKSEEPL